MIINGEIKFLSLRSPTPTRPVPIHTDPHKEHVRMLQALKQCNEMSKSARKTAEAPEAGGKQIEASSSSSSSSTASKVETAKIEAEEPKEAKTAVTKLNIKLEKLDSLVEKGARLATTLLQVGSRSPPGSHDFETTRAHSPPPRPGHAPVSPKRPPGQD